MKLFSGFILIMLCCSPIYIGAQTIEDTPEKKHSLLTDRYIANVGIFLPEKSIKVRADGATRNEVIDFDRTFQLRKYQTTFAFNLFWRFSKNKKWNVALEHFAVKTKREAHIEKELQWRDRTFLVGANVEAGFKMNLYRIFFGRTISLGDHHELFGGLGLHAMDIKSYLEGDLYVDIEGAELELQRKSANVIAPVPNIGFNYIYAPNDKWAFQARLDWFSLNVDEYGGRIWNLAPGIKYQVFDHFGLGLNFRYFETRMDVNKKKWKGKAIVRYSGPFISVSGNF